MNNKGQTLGLAIMSAIAFFIIALMTVNFVMSEVSNARNNLSCADAANISDGTKLLCLVMDTTVIYWIIIAFSVTLGIIISRVK